MFLNTAFPGLKSHLGRGFLCSCSASALHSVCPAGVPKPEAKTILFQNRWKEARILLGPALGCQWPCTIFIEAPLVKAKLVPRFHLVQGKWLCELRSRDSFWASICTPYHPPWLSSLSKTSPSKTLQGQVSSLWTSSRVILWIYIGKECGNACGVNKLYALPKWKSRFHPAQRRVST